MKKFNRILEQYVKENESLTRVRLKVDPKDRSGIDFRDFDGYEGYILKEDKYFNVLIEGMDFPIMQVPFSIIKVVDIKDKDTFDRVKVAAIKKINEIKDITPEFINKIGTCDSVDFFEQYLKEEGLSDFDLKDIYRNYIFTDTFTEAVDWKTVGNTIGAIASPAFALDLAFKNLKKKKNKNTTSQSEPTNRIGYTQNLDNNFIKRLPAIPIEDSNIQIVQQAITQNPNFKLDQASNGFSNISGTSDIIFLEPVGNSLNIKIFNINYIDRYNPVLSSTIIDKLKNYFNKQLPNESSTAYSFNTKSVFKIAGSPVIS